MMMIITDMKAGANEGLVMSRLPGTCRCVRSGGSCSACPIYDLAWPPPCGSHSECPRSVRGCRYLIRVICVIRVGRIRWGASNCQKCGELWPAVLRQELTKVDDDIERLARELAGGAQHHAARAFAAHKRLRSLRLKG
jgi:hypothetical protein